MTTGKSDQVGTHSSMIQKLKSGSHKIKCEYLFDGDGKLN